MEETFWPGMAFGRHCRRALQRVRIPDAAVLYNTSSHIYGIGRTERSSGSSTAYFAHSYPSGPDAVATGTPSVRESQSNAGLLSA